MTHRGDSPEVGHRALSPPSSSSLSLLVTWIGAQLAEFWGDAKLGGAGTVQIGDLNIPQQSEQV